VYEIGQNPHDYLTPVEYEAYLYDHKAAHAA